LGLDLDQRLKKEKVGAWVLDEQHYFASYSDWYVTMITETFAL
jgi:hypothetical protein